MEGLWANLYIIVIELEDLYAISVFKPMKHYNLSLEKY